MSVFPGDMSIGWGGGAEPREELPSLPPQEEELEPLDIDTEQNMCRRITDLEERLRSLTLVVNTLVVCNENLERVVKNMLIASVGKEGETN